MFFSHFAYTQSNLVPNPSFELSSNCFNQPDNFPSCLSWFNPAAGVFGATPDYFNSCFYTSSTSPFSPPVCPFPRTGNAEVGIYVYEGADPEAREFIEVGLKEPLTQGKEYCISFYVYLNRGMYYASNNLGAYLSNDMIQTTSVYYIPVTPQINASQILSDSAVWIEVSGNYYANGGEQYLTIGNFFPAAATQIAPISFTGLNASYYYIDDVSLTTCNQMIPNVFTPNDDGENDYWIVTGVPPGATVQIYDRWGTKVNAQLSDDLTGTFKWNGKAAGKNCAEGTYYYLISSKGEFSSGYLQLIR